MVAAAPWRLETLANEWVLWDRGVGDPYKYGGLMGPAGRARSARLAQACTRSGGWFGPLFGPFSFIT
jgi:hypothetical protein